jgi:hypothetical protein
MQQKKKITQGKNKQTGTQQIMKGNCDISAVQPSGRKFDLV